MPFNEKIRSLGRDASAKNRKKRKAQALRVIRGDARRLILENPKWNLDRVAHYLSRKIADRYMEDARLLNASYKASTIKRMIKGIKGTLPIKK